MAPPEEHRFKPGQSGNPGGRVKLARAPSVALAELNDTPGATSEEIIENFLATRRASALGIVAADHKAIAAFKRELAETVGVSQMNATMDRLEGKVTQRLEVGADADTLDAIGAAAAAARRAP